MSHGSQVVHIRKVKVGGDDVPKRTTFEVFYPAGKGRKRAEEVRSAIESFIASRQVDYKAVLTKYIAHVWDSEGEAYTGDWARSRFFDSVQFTDEEWDALQECDPTLWEEEA